MNWIEKADNGGRLRLEADEPAVLDTWSLTVAVRDAVDQKPSIEFGGKMAGKIALSFPSDADDLDDRGRADVEAILSAHDGTAAKAADEQAKVARDAAERQKRASVDAIRVKLGNGETLDLEEASTALRSLLGA